MIAEVNFPNTVPPFYNKAFHVSPPPKPEQYERWRAGSRAHNRWLADFCAELPGRRAGIDPVRGALLLGEVPPETVARLGNEVVDIQAHRGPDAIRGSEDDGLLVDPMDVRDAGERDELDDGVQVEVDDVDEVLVADGEEPVFGAEPFDAELRQVWRNTTVST